jgi:hypothetical protein
MGSKLKQTRHEVRKSDGSRSTVHISASARSTGSDVRSDLNFRVQDFGTRGVRGTGIRPRCSVCHEHVATIRAKSDDLCTSCLAALSHAMGEALRTKGERGKEPEGT